MGPIGTPLLFVDNNTRTISQRDRELRAAAVRAHAAKISHQRRNRPCSNEKPRGRKRGSGSTGKVEGSRAESGNADDAEGEIDEFYGPRIYGVQSTTNSTTVDNRCLSLVGRSYTRNLWLLDQTSRDPFNVEASRNVSATILDLMNYAYEYLFPMNMPAVDKKSVKAIMTSRRKLAVQNLAEFHAQVSNVATMAFAVVKDKPTLDIITRARLTHQSIAIKLIGQELMELRGPPSELLIQKVLLLSTQGGDPLDSWGLEVHPESPIVRGSNLKGYHRFRITPEHHHALVYLLKEKGGLDKITMVGLARRLQLSDISTATRECKHPSFPLLPSLGESVSRIIFSFDEPALELKSVLGSGFAPLLWTTLTTIHSNFLVQACKITVALDQYHRGGVRHSPLNDLNISVVVLQHRLYSAPTLLELYAEDSEIDYVDYLNEATRLATMIYMDMVLWPLPWAVGVKPRLAARLKGILPHLLDLDPELPSSGRLDSQAALDLDFYHVYLLLLGGIAATYTLDRHYYAEQLFIHSCPHFQGWPDFKHAMERFLWWGYVFEEPAFKLWTEAFEWGMSAFSESRRLVIKHLDQTSATADSLPDSFFKQFPSRPR